MGKLGRGKREATRYPTPLAQGVGKVTGSLRVTNDQVTKHPFFPSILVSLFLFLFPFSAQFPFPFSPFPFSPFSFSPFPFSPFPFFLFPAKLSPVPLTP